VAGSACGAGDVETLAPAATSAGAFLSGAGTTVPACCTTLCSDLAATTGAGADAEAATFALAAAGLDAVEFAVAGAGVEVAAFAVAATGLVAVASAGVEGAGAGTAGLAALEAAAVFGAALFGTVLEAAAGAEGAVETTTVVDLTRVVVQPPDVVVALDAGAAAAGVLAEGEAAAGALVVDAATVVVEEGAAAAGADVAGAVVELPALDDTFEPAGAAGEGGGEACFTAEIVVSRSAVMVVSRRTVPAFDALRTLSVGRAGEADRAVAKRTCSIIAE
jgi:hypothetical protein